MSLDSEIVGELVEEIAGKDVVELVELIKGKEDVSEFKIAEKIGITVNQVRNMLYRLYSHNLVSFTRKKDKKKGWYIYYWTFDERKGYELFVKIKKEKLKILKERLVNEKEGSYFICPNECIRLDLETSMEHDFKCPDCGKILEQEDNEKRVKSIEREINEISVQLAKPFVETPRRKPRAPAKKKPAKRKPRKRATKRKAPAKRRTTKRKPTKRKPRKKPARRVPKRKPARKKPAKRKPRKKPAKRRVAKRKPAKERLQ